LKIAVIILSFCCLYAKSTVTYVIDGDTFKVNDNGIEKTIRMSGIDTPETKHPYRSIECYGQEASLELDNLLHNKTIQLDYQGKDIYNRYLAYVYVDGMSINEYMIFNGYAVHTKYPHKYQAKYSKLETIAQHENVGLWQHCR